MSKNRTHLASGLVRELEMLDDIVCSHSRPSRLHSADEIVVGAASRCRKSVDMVAKSVDRSGLTVVVRAARRTKRRPTSSPLLQHHQESMV